MAITDNLVFRIKPASTDTVPTDTIAGQTMAGTVGLYNDSTYGYLWRIAAGNNVASTTLTGQGSYGESAVHTIALRFRLTGRAANYQRWMMFGWDTETGMLLGNGGATSGGVRWGQIAGGSTTSLMSSPSVSSGVVRTLVMRISMGGTDVQDAWFDTTGRSGTTPDSSTSTSFAFGTGTLDSLRFLADTGETLDILDFAHWTRSCTDAECAALADNLRGTIDAADTTPPTLTSPTGTSTGSTTATGTVSTNESGGTLYYLATTNATETAATVKAGASQSVSATGTQNVTFSGLTASTTYYPHYLHRDAAGNDSTVANGSSFETSAAGAITGASSITLGSITSAATGTVTTATATLTIPIKNNTGTVLTSTTIPKVTVLKLSDMSIALSLTSQTSNGSGNLVISSVSLASGTGYVTVLAASDGSALGVYYSVAA